MKSKPFLHIVLLIIIGITLYANTFQNEFVWDDDELIVRNPYIKSWRHLQDIFTRDLFYHANGSSSFRPIQSLSLMLDYHFWRLNPFGYHLTNILLHISAAILVYLLVNLISSGNRALSLITGLIFITHPIHTQAVTYISGRADLLAGVFSLLTIYLYIYPVRKKLSIFSFILAILSKESALILPLILILYDILLGEKKGGQQATSLRGAIATKQSKKLRLRSLSRAIQLRLLPPYLIRGRNDKARDLARNDTIPNELFRIPRHLYFFAVVGIYAGIRFFLINFKSKPLLDEHTLYTRMLTAVKAGISYIRLLFLPVGLHMERSIPHAKSILEPDVLVSIGLLSIFFIFIFKLYRYSRIACFGFIWFFLNLLPVSNCLIPLNATIAEHWLYLPSIGFFLGAAALGLKLTSSKKPVIRQLNASALIAALAFYSILTINRNRDWRDSITLYENTLKYSKSIRVLNNLAVAYHSKGQTKKAIRYLKEIVRVAPAYTKAYINLAMAYNGIGEGKKAMGCCKKALQLAQDGPDAYKAHCMLAIAYDISGNYELAISHFKKSLRLNPDDSRVHYNLGSICAKRAKDEEAVLHFKKSVELNPDCPYAHNSLGTAYEHLNRLEKAVRHYRRAVRLKPEYADACYNLGVVCAKLGENKKAVLYYQKAIELSEYSRAYNNLGVIYAGLGEKEKAISSYQKAIKAEPEYADAYNNLGVVYGSMGRHKEAIKYWEKALELNPDYTDAQKNLKIARGKIGP